MSARSLPKRKQSGISNWIGFENEVGTDVAFMGHDDSDDFALGTSTSNRVGFYVGNSLRTYIDTSGHWFYNYMGSGAGDSDLRWNTSTGQMSMHVPQPVHFSKSIVTVTIPNTPSKLAILRSFRSSHHPKNLGN